MSAGVALVTGAGRGIGRGCAEALAARGFAVAVNGLAEADVADTVAAVEQAGAAALALPFDVTDLDAHDGALDRAEAALGPLTTLVNNAGVGVSARGDPLDVSPESWDRCMAVNARALFFLTQRVAARLIAAPRDGFRSVVSITSANASAVAVPRAEYCASKAAAAMATQAWAARLGPEGVHVYDVRPGLIETDMTAPVIEGYRRRAAEGLTLIPRVGTSAEVGGIVATLASGGLPYTTGQVIAADGGMLVPRF